MEMYPKTDKEKQGCKTEIEKMKFKREQYKKRLYEKNNAHSEVDKEKM